MSLLPSIPGNWFAAVQHSFCVRTLGISTILCYKFAKAFQQCKNVSCHGTSYQLSFMNLHTLSFQATPGQSWQCKMLSYTAFMFHQMTSFCLRYLTASTSATSKCLCLIFCIWTLNTQVYTYWQGLEGKKKASPHLFSMTVSMGTKYMPDAYCKKHGGFPGIKTFTLSRRQ